jgi:hypothetical protein
LTELKVPVLLGISGAQTTPTGKILRRHLVDELAGQTPGGVPVGDIAEPACT